MHKFAKMVTGSALYWPNPQFLILTRHGDLALSPERQIALTSKLTRSPAKQGLADRTAKTAVSVAI